LFAAMSRGDTARLFVAVDVPLAIREELAAWGRLVVAEAARSRSERRAPKGVSPVMRPLRADSLHLTLCFLGSRPVDEIGALSAALEECALPVDELSVGAPLLLPTRRPRALAVEIHDPEGCLTLLQSRASSAMSRASGWEGSERHGFRAHVTVARMRSDARWAPASQPLPPTPQLCFVPERVVLYRSWLAPEGASYEALASCELPLKRG
jgi:RNA 2',3'-cyclic 3'-phosphodiesterase